MLKAYDSHITLSYIAHSLPFADWRMKRNKCKFHVLSVFICSVESFRVFSQFKQVFREFSTHSVYGHGNRLSYTFGLLPGLPSNRIRVQPELKAQRAEPWEPWGGLLGSHFVKADLCLAGCLIFILARSPSPYPYHNPLHLDRAARTTDHAHAHAHTVRRTESFPDDIQLLLWLRLWLSLFGWLPVAPYCVRGTCDSICFD